jgi:hypothetical protein
MITGRLGRYNNQACLHIFYIHPLQVSDIAKFRCRAAEYKENVLDHTWVLTPSDKTDVSPSYDEILIRNLAVAADTSPNARPAVDWQCTNQGCLMLNYSYCPKCVRCHQPRPFLPVLPPCPCAICVRLLSQNERAFVATGTRLIRGI